MVRSGFVLGLASQVTVLAVLAGTAGLSLAGWLAGVGVGLATMALLTRALRRRGAAALGPANHVTLIRATLVGGVTALVAESSLRPVPSAILATVAVLALLLDAVDGQVARRTATASAVGARFDMEVDAFLILVLSVHAAGSIGRWVLAIGAARYLFVAAGWALPWLRQPAPPRYWCKVVAAVQGVVLTIAAARVLTGPPIIVLVAAALALLTESFAHDVWWLWRHRTQPRERATATDIALVGSR